MFGSVWSQVSALLQVCGDLDTMLINPRKEFKLDTTFVVHPDGLEPPTSSV
jgi:hypothetical protein